MCNVYLMHSALCECGQGQTTEYVVIEECILYHPQSNVQCYLLSDEPQHPV